MFTTRETEQDNQFYLSLSYNTLMCPGVLTHLIRWQICERFGPLLSEGQSL